MRILILTLTKQQPKQQQLLRQQALSVDAAGGVGVQRRRGLSSALGVLLVSAMMSVCLTGPVRRRTQKRNQQVGVG
jgi:hypothetical protein